ncbi:hypothetical protein [Roseateles violae]|uniref:Uncharacterized protein n=1 Tax=Roseateles violae TaxID=3058042 RepID=A0ABT8DZS5_9BURK|nr:hypothetical protein [Pelomonas sp. PFR6]MDN3923107.1 hypothetical protein [Pelomonas sp. PFR6]
MIIPLHLLPADLHSDATLCFDLPAEQAPRYTLGGAELDPALRPRAAAVELGSPIAGPVAMADLQRFEALMAGEGIALQPTRMLYDRLYACERLAQGHASASQALRNLSMQLFHDYQRAGEWIGLIH